MCGVVGIFNNEEASTLAYLCLYALQHRGQESAGIVTSDGESVHEYRDMGLVSDVFDRAVLAQLTGKNAIGHVRYSTSGGSARRNTQPFVIEYQNGTLALAHNGNLTNAEALRATLESSGSIFQSTMDSEVIMHLFAVSKAGTFPERIVDALRQVEGAYSLVFLNEDSLIAVRDPRGFRPLVLGKVGASFVVASETCALDLIDAEYLREIEPGEMVIIDKKGLHSSKPFDVARKSCFCIFEYIYFARPDSEVYGRSVYMMRKGFGHQLAKEHPVDADMVIPVPDSGVPAAIGYAEESSIPFQMGLVRNHYVGRTFIEPSNEIRHFGVKIKLNPDRKLLEGKKIIVVDDSIVRGTTSKKIVEMLKKAGAAEVHMRISSPPTAWSCFYGIDTPTREELIGAHKSVEKICKFIEADSLNYLSYDGLYWFQKEKPGEWYCDACFTGKYPTRLIDAPHIEEEIKKCSINGE